MHTVHAFSIFHSSLIILVVAIILLDLFAKPLSVNLAEIITVSFIQFLTLLKSTAVFLDQVFIVQKTNPSYCTVTYTACSCLFNVHLPPFFRRMMTGLSVLPSMTPSLKMDSWAATNQYAARCPSWQRNCVNATPPPAQVSLLWLIHCFSPSFSSSVIKEESVSYLGSELAFYFIFHNTISLCLVLQRQLF